MTYRTQHFGSYPEGQGHSMTFQQNSFKPITLWFEVKFYNYFTGMITVLRQLVECNIWVATLKAKVTAWLCSKIVSGPKLCYLKWDFTTTFDKLLLCVQYLFGITWFQPALVLIIVTSMLTNVCEYKSTHYNSKHFAHRISYKKKN